MRYYHAAIDGAWPQDPIVMRRSARLELARALVANGDATHALPELVALTADLPDDPELLTEVARLLFEAGADSRALTLVDRLASVARRRRNVSAAAAAMIDLARS